MTAPKTTPIKRIYAEIVGGRHDEHLMTPGGIAAALLERVKIVGKPSWSFELRDLKVSEDDITLDEYTALCTELGVAFDDAPDPAESLEVAKALAVTCGGSRCGWTADVVGAIPVKELVHSMGQYLEGRAPFGSPPVPST